tara:strand:- start:877 stop:1641 length:765 start_codon:yes stop_codon:yes gene_type:complete
MKFSRIEKAATGTILALVGTLGLAVADTAIDKYNPSSDTQETVYEEPITENPELTLPLNVRFSTKDTKAEKVELLRTIYPDLTIETTDLMARVVYGEARSEGREGMTAVASSQKRRYDIDKSLDLNFQGARLFTNEDEPVTLENVVTYEVNRIPQYNTLRDSTLLTTPRENLEQESIYLAEQIVFDVLAGVENPYSTITHFENSDETKEGRTVGWPNDRTRCENQRGPDTDNHQTYFTTCETLKKGTWIEVDLE